MVYNTSYYEARWKALWYQSGSMPYIIKHVKAMVLYLPQTPCDPQK